MSSSAPSYHLESVGGHSIITLHPSLNDVQWANIDQIGADIVGRIQGLRSPSVLVDLSALNYVGSAMVALVVRIWKAVNERDGKMAVANRSEMVLEVLRLAGLANVWTIVPSRDEGLRALGGQDGGGSGNGVLALLAVVATALAAVAVFVPQILQGQLSAAALRGAGFALAGAGLILGTALTLRSAGALRGLAILLVLASIAAGVFGAIRPPDESPPGELPDAAAPVPVLDPTESSTPPPAGQTGKPPEAGGTPFPAEGAGNADPAPPSDAPTKIP